MIKVIGTVGCGKCMQAKRRLAKKDKEFSYVLLGEMSTEDQEKYKDMALETGQRSFPIIIKGDEIVKLEEILNE